MSIKEFLLFTKAARILPDCLKWHEVKGIFHQANSGKWQDDATTSSALTFLEFVAAVDSLLRSIAEKDKEFKLPAHLAELAKMLELSRNCRPHLPAGVTSIKVMPVAKRDKNSPETSDAAGGYAGLKTERARLGKGPARPTPPPDLDVPEHPMFCIYSANQRTEKGNPMYLAADELTPWNEHGPISGNIGLAQIKHSEAASASERALQAYPDDPHVLARMAESLLKVSKWDEADDAAAQGLRAQGPKPKNKKQAALWDKKLCARLQFLRGKASVSRGDRKEAKQFFQQAVEHNEKFAEAWHGLGLALKEEQCDGIKKWRPVLDKCSAELVDVQNTKKAFVDSFAEGDEMDPESLAYLKGLNAEISQLQTDKSDLIDQVNKYKNIGRDGDAASQRAVELKGSGIRL